jgi:hypothetical protein
VLLKGEQRGKYERATSKKGRGAPLSNFKKEAAKRYGISEREVTAHNNRMPSM